MKDQPIEEFTAMFVLDDLPEAWLGEARSRSHADRGDSLGLAALRVEQRLVSVGVAVNHDHQQPSTVFVYVGPIPDGPAPTFVEESEKTWGDIGKLREFLARLLGNSHVANVGATFHVGDELNCNMVAQDPCDHLSPAATAFAEKAVIESVGYRFTGAPDGILSLDFESAGSNTRVSVRARGTVDLEADVPDGAIARRMARTVVDHFFSEAT